MAIPAIAHDGRTIREMAVDPAAVFQTGAAVILDGDSEIAEAGANPTTIVGFTPEPATKASEDPPMRVNPRPGKVLVMVAQPHSTFLMEIWSSGAQVEPVQADIGTSYGIAKDAGNGAWYVDRDDVATTAVTVVDIVEYTENSPTPSLVMVKVDTPILG